jgi:hypothetical protein
MIEASLVADVAVKDLARLAVKLNSNDNISSISVLVEKTSNPS